MNFRLVMYLSVVVSEVVDEIATDSLSGYVAELKPNNLIWLAPHQ